jgi:nicotinate-nucleotide pyrophosphorylase (carboxylating)
MICLDKTRILADVRRALEEDVGTGDLSAGLIPNEIQALAELVSREPMLVCGIPWVNTVFQLVNPSITIEWQVKEGEWLAHPSRLCWIRGPAASILTAERAALNFLQTLAGTATKTKHYVDALKNTQSQSKSISKTQLLDTRKTIPGLRYAQKYAVSCGGGTNHRMGLYDAFLIKENHIMASGSIRAAIEKARSLRPEVLLEVEVENLKELAEAIDAKPDRILLDNFSLKALEEAVKVPRPDKITLEVSGGVTLTNIRAIAETGVDYISVGDITKSVKAIDLSMLIRSVG